ncbi:hypothetical protein ACFQX6_54335 [Streptosporangium lutulentum]
MSTSSSGAIRARSLAFRRAVAGSWSPANRVTPVEGPGEPVRVDVAEAGRRPGAERRGQDEGVLVVGVDDRPGVLGRQRLDAERAGQRDQGQFEFLVQGEPPGEVVIVGIHLVGGLALQVQGPAVEAR